MSPLIKVPELCDTHQYLLVHGCGYKPTDTWRALVVVAQVALFQAVTADDFLQDRMGGEISKVSTLGCLACRKPDAFGEIVEAGKSHDLGKIKTLGEKWLQRKMESSGGDT